MKKVTEKKIIGLFFVCICILLNAMLPSFGVFADTAINEQTVNNPFTDVQRGKWYVKAVLFCKENGYLAGTSESTFSPRATVTRAMAVTALWQLAGARTIDLECVFADVPEDAWFYKAVIWAKETGITSGTSEKTFSPNEPVTREQLVLMFMKYAEKVDRWNISIKADIEAYRDADKISKWAKSALGWAVSTGVIAGNGNGTLNPKGNTTRAELAQILYKFMNQSNHLTYTKGLLEKYNLWTLLEADSALVNNPDHKMIYMLTLSVLNKDASWNLKSIPPMKVYARVFGKGTWVDVELERISSSTMYLRDFNLEKVMEYPGRIKAEITFVIDGEYETLPYEAYVRGPEDGYHPV